VGHGALECRRCRDAASACAASLDHQYDATHPHLVRYSMAANRRCNRSTYPGDDCVLCGCKQLDMIAAAAASVFISNRIE